jgi:hypothetical protein
MRRILTALLFLGCSLLLTAQTMEQFIEDAKKQHENQNYFGAYDSYRIATKFDESRMDLWYNQGENARLYTAYETAMKAYQHVLMNGDPTEFPELQFRLGQVQQFLGNYAEASVHYENYLAQSGAGLENRAAAEKNLSDCAWAAERMLEADTFNVSHLPRDINSKFSDFAYRPDTDSIFFSSNRVDFEKDSLDPHRFLARIFRVMRNGDTANPGQLTHRPTEEYVHMAHTTFTADKSRVYYTMCNYVGATETVRCDLYFSNLEPSSPKWGPPVKMGLNVPGANNSMPHVAFFPGTGQETLFFASDRAGGQGGMDLYMAPLNADGTAGEVVNLADLNTEGNEITPFFDTEGCRMYFSTDGRMTLGGFDIYSASAKDGNFGEPVHLNAPVNGSFHDRYYIIARDEDKAYFSSNRQGEDAIRWTPEENACCDDIYSVPFDETIILDVFTFRKLDETPLDRATVTLHQVNEDGSRELIGTKTQTTGNQFSFEIETGVNYEINGTRIAFGPAEEQASLMEACDRPDTDRLTRNLFLPQLLIVNVFDEQTREPLDSAKIQLANRGPDPASLLADEFNPSGNRFEFLVRLDDPYFIHAERIDYLPTDTSFTIPEAQVNERGEFEVDIFLRKDPFKLIPISVYFDNDRPHPSSRQITSDTQYVPTNLRYFNRQEAFIKDAIKPSMTKEEAFQVEGRVRDFFKLDVLGGRNELIEFFDVLLERLEMGKTYEMTVTGFASKRGNPGYNLNLSKRRVDSVVDFFMEHRGGAMSKFLSPENNDVEPALKIIPQFSGDTEADPNDRTVFGLAASRSRKVTITKLKATN